MGSNRKTDPQNPKLNPSKNETHQSGYGFTLKQPKPTDVQY